MLPEWNEYSGNIFYKVHLGKDRSHQYSDKGPYSSYTKRKGKGYPSPTVRKSLICSLY
jgi:hypothetical protein